VREAITRMLPDRPRFGPAMHVGAYWTRDGRVEVDLVGGDRQPTATELGFVGSIKWRDLAPFTRTDARALAEQARQVPGGGGVPLSGVAPNGATEAARSELAEVITAEDIVAAW
jgi:hypothetical protein